MFSVESSCSKCGKKIKAYHFPAKCPVCKAYVPLPTVWLSNW